MDLTASIFPGEALKPSHQPLMTPPRPKDCPRVVLLDHVARLSGAELSLQTLVGAMRGFEVHAILGEDGPLAAALSEAGASVEVMPLADAARDLRRDSMRAGRTGFRGPAAVALYVPRLIRRLRELRPDLIHTVSLKSALYGGSAARTAGVPMVWSLHDRVAADYLPAQAAALVRFLIRRLPSAVIANSQATLSTVAPVRAPATVIGSPIRAPRSPKTSASGIECVGMVGRLTPWKGQHVFLEAFARAFPDPGVQCSVVGSPLFGEQDYEHRLHRQAEELGLMVRVDFRGFRSDIEHELARLDALVHASTVAEPFGRVVVEGMAMGVPVVAADQGGPAEVITQGRDGLLYRAGNVEALAGALRRLAGDAELRAQLNRGGRETARAFEPAVIARKVEAVYASVLDGR